MIRWKPSIKRSAPRAAAATVLLAAALVAVRAQSTAPGGAAGSSAPAARPGAPAQGAASTGTAGTGTPTASPGTPSAVNTSNAPSDSTTPTSPTAGAASDNGGMGGASTNGTTQPPAGVAASSPVINNPDKNPLAPAVSTDPATTPAGGVAGGADGPGGAVRLPPPAAPKAVAASHIASDNAALPLLDLNACYQLALIRTEQVGVQWEEIQAAGSRYWQAVSAIFPTVSIGATQFWQNQNANFGGAGGGFVRGDHFGSALQMHQPLFSGFKEFYGMAGAGAQKAAAASDWRRIRQTIYQDVAALFYQILMYEEDERLLQQIRGVLGSQVTEINRRTGLGRSRPADRLSAEADAADAAALIEQTRGLWRVSKETLAFWTGIPASRLRLVNTQKLPSVHDLSLYIQGAILRPDVEANRQRERAAGDQVGVVRGDYWPQVGVDANYYLQKAPGDTREWDVALTVDLPIFNGFYTQAREGEAKAQLRQATLRLSQIERTAVKETRVAYAKFISASRELVQLDTLAQTASRNAQVQAQDYQKGISNYLQVLDAQRQALDARRREAEARQRAQNALAELAVAAGETPVTGTGGLVP